MMLMLTARHPPAGWHDPTAAPARRHTAAAVQGAAPHTRDREGPPTQRLPDTAQQQKPQPQQQQLEPQPQPQSQPQPQPQPQHHVEEEVDESASDPLYKTELCRTWTLSGGQCPYGARCRFAHGKHELRKVAKPTSFRTRKCKFFHEGGYCRYGDRCFFVHASSQSPHRDVAPASEASSSPSSSASQLECMGVICAHRLPIFQALAPN